MVELSMDRGKILPKSGKRENTEVIDNQVIRKTPLQFSSFTL
jgi:ABC-type enterochelin transport system substrate-binding protein